VRNPRLWWTWDTGVQNLYKAAAAISPPPAGGRDAREVVVGIRAIARNEDMSYWLNGKHLYLKGAWYAIGDLLESRPTRENARNDLFLAQPALEAIKAMQARPPIRDARLAPGASGEWDPAELNEHGVEGFNQVEVKADSEELMTISGNPLLVMGRYGEGRTAAFMGFTPDYVERRSEVDTQVVFPYLLDQEFFSDPKTRAYFALFMKILAAVTGEKPAISHPEILMARSKPLFQTLKEQPAAMLQPMKAVAATAKGRKASGTLTLSNGPAYARLVRMRVEWHAPELQVPYLVTYSDNYFDLLPAETREILLEFLLGEGANGFQQGNVIIAGSNLEQVQVPVMLTQG